MITQTKGVRPLLRGLTPFQKKVYKAVLTIPRGEVRSYKWVACKIGKPSASRAVGQALKKNPYTVIIPCHRVVKADGTLGGYSRGLKIKKKLLKKEGIDECMHACYNDNLKERSKYVRGIKRRFKQFA